MTVMEEVDKENKIENIHTTAIANANKKIRVND